MEVLFFYCFVEKKIIMKIKIRELYQYGPIGVLSVCRKFSYFLAYFSSFFLLIDWEEKIVIRSFFSLSVRPFQRLSLYSLPLTVHETLLLVLLFILITARIARWIVCSSFGLSKWFMFMLLTLVSTTVFQNKFFFLKWQACELFFIKKQSKMKFFYFFISLVLRTLCASLIRSFLI